MTKLTPKQLIDNYYNCFEWQKNKEINVFKREVMKDDSPLNTYYEDLSKVIHETESGEDFVYSKVVSALEFLSEEVTENTKLDDLGDIDFHEWADGEVDVYTSNLTDWLAGSVYNVYWLDEAINELGADDGFKILASAQYLAIQEIGYKVRDMIMDYTDDKE